MPRYFFNARIEGDVIRDQGGTDLRDTDEAWRIAWGTADAMLQDPDAQMRLLAASLVVTDETGEVVLEFPFAEALTPLPQAADPLA
jgi:hypothetical protein